MKKENIKVILWGFGAMGNGLANMLLKKDGVEIVGVLDVDPNKVGKSMYEVLGVEKGNHKDIIVSDDTEKVITEKAADIVLLATDSFVKGAFDKMVFCLEKGINVITTAEQMAYPEAQEPELAAELDKIAKKNNVSVLGTGINPGLIMDLLVVCLTGACEEVEEIEAERVNSLSPFGRAVMVEQGVGSTVEDFDKGTEDGTIAGHVGFHESIRMITDAIGWKLDKPITQSQEPIVSKVYRKTPYAEVEAGNVAGANMLGFGVVDGKTKIKMIHPQQIEPQLEGVETGDYIRIKGTPDISMAINPEIPGGIGTVAMCVNMIPHVLNSNPGLKTMIDLPIPRAIMGDMRELIETK